MNSRIEKRSLKAGRRDRRLAATIVLATVLGATSGCVLPVKAGDGSRHYVVVGIGIVSVPRADAASTVSAAKVQALGVVATTGPGARLAIGYINTHQVEVAADTQWAVVEIGDAIAAPMKISASTCQSQERNQ